jgi:AAA domain
MADAIALDEVEILPIESLWRGYVRTGEVTLLAAAGGMGKSSVLYALAAAVTRGSLMPDGTESDLAGGTVLLAEYEDKLNTMIAPKLLAAKADMRYVRDASNDGLFATPDDNEWLEEQVNKYGNTRLMTINPITAASTISINSGPQKLRTKLLRPLEKIAERTGIAIIVVGHMTKDGKIGGSAAMVDAPRQVLQIVATANPEIKMLIRGKHNVDKGQGGVPFKIVGEGPQDAHVEWLDAKDLDLALMPVDEIPGRAPSEQTRVLAVLGDATAPMTGQEVRQACGEPAVEYNSVRTALSRLTRDGFSEQPEKQKYVITAKGKAKLAEKGVKKAA